MVLHLQFSEMASSAGEEGGICCRRKLKQTNRNMVMVGSTFLSLSLSLISISIIHVMKWPSPLFWILTSFYYGPKSNIPRYHPFQFTPMHPSHSHIIHRSIFLTNSSLFNHKDPTVRTCSRMIHPRFQLKKRSIILFTMLPQIRRRYFL